ncbi:AdoMet_MTases domain containing protein [Candidatus Nanopelagicaceae bacterium]
MTESTRKTLHIGEIYRVEIEKVAHGGHFIARHEGAVIFLRHGIPGEIVEVEITGVEKSFVRADVVAVIESSPSRVAPACQYAGSCGGCDFQHVSIERQRELKSEVIAEQFARIAKMEVDVEVEEVSSPHHWRTRYAASTDSNGAIGFKGSRSNAVIPISSCPVLIPEIDLSTLPRDHISARQRVEVSLATNGERTISIMDQRESRTAQRAVPTIIEGSQVLNYRVNERDYEVSQSSFWQSNINAPEKLVEVVLSFADLRTGDHLLDLYGGVGLFAGAALPIVGPGGRIDIVEGSATATDDARRNFAADENVHVHTGDVAREIRKFNRADVVVLDPPRTGAGKPVIESLGKLGARSIVYVACDPAALARDTTYLNEIGYHLDDIRALDLFPMTHHIESIALFTLSKVS